MLVLEQSGNHARVHLGDRLQRSTFDPGRNLVEQVLGTLGISAAEDRMLGKLIATDINPDIAAPGLFELLEDLAGQRGIDMIDIHHAPADFPDFGGRQGPRKSWMSPLPPGQSRSRAAFLTPDRCFAFFTPAPW